MARTSSTIAALIAAAMLLAGHSAASASASEGINAFSVTTSSTQKQGGGHPDLTMSFELDSPGAPEAARNIVVNT